MSTKVKTVFTITFSNSKRSRLIDPKLVVDQIERLIEEDINNVIIKFAWGVVGIQSILEGDILVPNVNNIGVNITIDKLPRTQSKYFDCVEAIARKKCKSLSEWLIIWSLEFWRDRNWLETDVVKLMRAKLRDSKFSKIFFVESIDDENCFHVNLNIYEIK